jgi:hypothetical protein
MTENSRLSALFRPASVAVHNDGDVLRQTREINLREQFGFFGIGLTTWRNFRAFGKSKLTKD